MRSVFARAQAVIRTKNWKKENPERARAQKKRHDTLHKDEISGSHKKYRENHLDQYRMYSENRRALLAGNTTEEEMLTQEQWEEVVNKYGGKCAYCGREIVHPTIDHVIPISRGGKHAKDNVVPACVHCNIVKNDKLLSELLEGWYA